MAAIGMMACSIFRDMRHWPSAIYANAEFLERIGCIPTKVLLHHADVYGHLRDAAELGFEVSDLKINWRTSWPAKYARAKDLLAESVENEMGNPQWL